LKVRRIKKRLGKEDLHLEANLRDAIADLPDGVNSIEGRWKSILGSDLTYVVMEHLRLNSSLSGRWVDSIEWESLTVESHRKVRGDGRLYWGYLNNVSGALNAEPFSANLELTRGGTRPRVAYSLCVLIDGIRCQIQK
jgi:hypothetical protein